MTIFDQPPEPPPQEQPAYSYPQMPSKIPDIQNNQDFFFHRLSSGNLLRELRLQLQGYEKEINDKGEFDWVKKNEALANKDGIAMIMYVLQSCGPNINTVLGYLQHEEIYQRCNQLWKKLAKQLGFGYIRYGIKRENREILIQSVVQQVHSALSRSEGGKEADQISVQAQRIEHTMQQVRNKPSFNPMDLIKRHER